VFLGQHSQTIDSKGRVVVPAKFRAQLASGAVVTRGLDNCLYLYARDEWQVWAEKLASLPLTNPSAREFQRIMLSGADEVTPDRVGRISIPESLRSHAGLESGAIFAGVGKRIEIASSANWKEFVGRVVEDTETLSQNFQDLGI
jgi:MraZ protein